MSDETRIEGRMTDPLMTLAMMPLLTKGELSTLCQHGLTWGKSVVSELARAGLVEGTTFILGGVEVVRWRLTGAGVRSVAEVKGTTAKDLLRRYPLSAEWEQSLLRRVRTVAACYRIATEAARIENGRVQWRWERADVFDGFLMLPSGRTVGICRLGNALSAKSIGSRVKSVCLLHDYGQVVGALIVVPGPIERTNILTRMRRPGLKVAVGVENTILDKEEGAAHWRLPLGSADNVVSLQKFLSGVMVRGMPERRRSPKRAAPPRDNETRGMTAPELVMSGISHSAQNLFDLIADWPLIEEQQAREMLNLKERRFRERRKELHETGMAVSLKFPVTRRRGTTAAGHTGRLALTNDGLRQVAWRDRVRLSELMNAWSIYEDEDGNAYPRIDGYRLEGSKMRALGRELRHNDGVHRLISTIQQDCLLTGECELAETLPPHRWERWFYYNRRRYGIKPDVTALINSDLRRFALLIEYEQRSIRPAQMVEKMQRYTRYFGALDTTMDFEVAPIALIVFPDRGGASRFAVNARRSSGRSSFRRNPRLKLLVSSMQEIGAKGFLGDCWLDPWSMDRGTMAISNQ